jgi:hypothetical protein
VEHIYNWTKRILLALPLAAAFTLTVLLNVPARFQLNRQHFAQTSFLFGRPWAWLLQRGQSGAPTHSMRGIVSYAVVLWVPALLDCVSLWLVLRVLELAARGSRR